MNTHTILSVPNAVLMDEVGNSLAQGRRVKFRVKGNSMRPFIYDGDVVELLPCKDVRKNDIVLANSDEYGYILHRIIKVDEKTAILRGDGNLYQKEYCRHKDILGKGIFVNGKGKFKDLSTNLSRCAGSIWSLLLLFRRGLWYLNRLITK